MNAPTIQATPQLQALLLDLISPVRTVPQSQVDALSATDWRGLLGMVRQHRLGPLLHWQLGQAHDGLKIPPEVLAELALSHTANALRSLTVQRELVLVLRILRQAGILSVALKGAYLAFHAYPHPALRPLRDLDILVPSDQTLRAYQILLDGGLARMEKYPGAPEEVIQTGSHLPPLRSPSGTVSVELHHRLFHRPRDNPDQTDLSEDQQFWLRCTTERLAGAEIAFESPTDLLLHLIVHAVYDHEFDNGPLVLSDLAFLLDTQTINWPLFWRLAEQGQHTKGCLLTLKLAQRYWGEKPIAWPERTVVADAPLDERVDKAALLMLRDFDARSDVRTRLEFASDSSPLGKARYLLRKVFVPKAWIAATYPVAQDDWRIYFWYPVRWWRLLTRRLPILWQSSLRHEAKEIADLRQWLGSTRM